MRIAATLAFLAISIPCFAGPGDPVAIVNGEPILRSELDAVMNQRPPVVVPLSAAQTRQMHQEIVNSLVDELLLRQFLKKNAPPADAAKVTEQMKALERGLAQQKKTIADYCKETHQTEAQLRSSLSSVIQWNTYAGAKMTDQVLQKYYQDNKDFFDKTTVRASHIVIRSSPGNSGEKQQAEAKLKGLRSEITTGKTTFAEAAQKYSQCPSGPKGGDLGYFSRKWMVDEPFAQAAFAMKPGEISEPVTTEFGVHLIQVVDRKQGQSSNFELIKDDVREVYLEEIRLATLNELRRTAKVEIKLP